MDHQHRINMLDDATLQDARPAPQACCERVVPKTQLRGPCLDVLNVSPIFRQADASVHVHSRLLMEPLILPDLGHTGVTVNARQVKQCPYPGNSRSKVYSVAQSVCTKSTASIAPPGSSLSSVGSLGDHTRSAGARSVCDSARNPGSSKRVGAASMSPSRSRSPAHGARSGPVSPYKTRAREPLCGGTHPRRVTSEKGDDAVRILKHNTAQLAGLIRGGAQ